MSTLDRRAEREVADYFNDHRPASEDKGPLRPRLHRFCSGLLTGMALGAVIRKLFG